MRTPSLVLRLITLLAVVIPAALYFRVNSQKQKIEDNLNLSRSALQEKLQEVAELEPRIVIAEENSATQQHLAEEEATKASSLQRKVETLSEKLRQTELAQNNHREEMGELQEINRQLRSEINTLRSRPTPPDLQEKLAQLQSQVLELEAENTSLKQSRPMATLPDSLPLQPHSPDPAFSPSAQLPQPVGEIVRVGPGGSFVILDYGRDEGAVEGQNLALIRNQKVVGLVRLTQITKDFSIAQILSSTNTGDNLSVPDIHVGDKAHIH